MVVVILVLAAVVVVSVLERMLSRRAQGHVQHWATEHGYRLVSIKRLWGSRGVWGWTFTTFAEGGTCRFFDITATDDRSIERVGTAKVCGGRPNTVQPVQVRWSDEF